MNAIPEMPYLAAEGLSRPIPLERFLPDCPVGVTRQYLDTLPAQDGWLLDPFGSNPLLDIEAAANGWRILVTENNPILAFMLRMLAPSRRKNEFLSALAEFASLARGTERLETHIRALYTTRCPICHQEIQASGYLWQRGQSLPYARLCRCPECGEEGEHPITDEDLQLLEPVNRGEKLPRARALGRVLQGNQEERPAVEEALKLYNPRSLYILFTMLNKLEGMDLEPQKRELLEALMISSLEAGASLWLWPNSGDPPRVLNLPAVYLEKNIWLEMEKSIDLWSQPAAAADLAIWPEQPDKAGICLFKGPIRALELPAEMHIERILCIPPRPNQAFWTLSALWSAWLWGRESETSFGQVLGRRRFDWHWHTNALFHAFNRAGELVGKPSGMFMGIGEPSPGMVLATGTAANCAGYELQGVAYRSSSDPIQMVWKKNEKDSASGANIQNIARTAIQDTLIGLGEPVEYLALYAAVITSLAVKGGLPARIDQYTQEKSSEIQGIIARMFNDRDFLRRFENTSQELDSGKWGLVNLTASQVPLADRVELAILEILRERNTLPAAEIDRTLARRFSGLLTPPGALEEFCLKSYAEYDIAAQAWTIKQQERGADRERDINEAVGLLQSLAKKLEFSCEGINPMTWKKTGELPYRFHLSENASLAGHIDPEDVETQAVFVFPGSRAELLKYKLLRDPQLREELGTNWHFLKFRALRNLAARGEITPALWQMMLDSDPITLEENTQLRMFG
jgi:hypothetical protein